MEFEIKTMGAAREVMFGGLERLGPGDAGFSRDVLAGLPPFSRAPRIADLGCGTGPGSIVLAQMYDAPVRAVDIAAEFIEELTETAADLGLGDLIKPEVADMGALDWDTGSVDLLWSEGAAYNLGFEKALKTWRPLMAQGGIAVVSEMSWFGDARPKEAAAFWQAQYPGMASEAENVARAENAGFEIGTVLRLPQVAWWENYYDPLRERMEDLAGVKSEVLQEMIESTRIEMDLFHKFSDHYGYSVYVMRVVEGHNAHACG